MILEVRLPVLPALDHRPARVAPTGFVSRHPLAGLGRVLLSLLLLSWATARAAEFEGWLNTGKAHFENRNAAKAIEAFQEAARLDPRSAAAQRNLARAFLLANRNPDALEALRRARVLEPEAVATAYLSGLAYLHQSRFDLARPLLAEAARLDPYSAAVRYQWAHACQLTKDRDQALRQLHETLRLDPLHAGAYFKLAALAAEAGQAEDYERCQQEFQRLRKLLGDQARQPAALEQCVHTQAEGAPVAAPRAPEPARARFRDVTLELCPEPATRSATAVAVLEATETGSCRLVLADGRGNLGFLTVDRQGRVVRTPAGVDLFAPAPFHQCVVGNFHDATPSDGRSDPAHPAIEDLLLVSTNALRLLERTGPDTFVDVTDRALPIRGGANRAAWVDYDHDGDLDLALARSTGVELWQNRGDGTFVSANSAAGVELTGPAVDVAVADLDSNVAIDLVAALGSAPAVALINQRTGRYAESSTPVGGGFVAQRVLAQEADNDGYPDVLLVATGQALLQYGQRPQHERFDLAGLDRPVAEWVEIDNDGWIELCVAGARAGSSSAGVVRLWRNLGPGAWAEITAATGLDALELAPVRDVLAADVDGDGDTDLVVVTANGEWRWLRHDGEPAGRQLAVRLVGLKTNPTGLGARVEARADGLRAIRTVQRPVTALGIGRHTRLDSVQVVWGNGVVDNQIDVPLPTAPVTLLTIAEKNVAAGSCPYLYAWDGKGFRFVTDLLGNAPLGLSWKRGAVLPADPEEIVEVGSTARVARRRGAFELVVTEELREVLYLDLARLLVVDHPAELEVHSTDKLGPPPFPPSEVWGVESLRPVLRAEGDDGLERTAALRAMDGVFAPPGRPRGPPYRGLCEPLTLTLEFAPLEAGRAWVLCLTGWIQYGDASVNIAASQHPTLPVSPPRLEFETPTGAWQPLDVPVGMPAGKTKTILCDLAGRVPPGTRRLRLHTSLELRWDRIALGERADPSRLRSHELEPRAARLGWRGFSEMVAASPDHPRTPVYRRVSAQPPWRTTPEGWCTRYGDVLGLVAARDERLAILNGGDALVLRFPAEHLPPVPAGWSRSIFLRSVGWDKDADPNVVDGDTVEPLPVTDRSAWWWETATRWVPRDRFAVRDEDPTARPAPLKALAP